MIELLSINRTIEERKITSTYQSPSRFFTFWTPFLKKKTMNKDTSSGLNGNKEFRFDWQVNNITIILIHESVCA